MRNVLQNLSLSSMYTVNEKQQTPPKDA